MANLSGKQKKSGRPVKHNYCDRAELHRELMLYKATGKPSDELIQMFYDITNGFLSSNLSRRHVDNQDKSAYAIQSLYLYSHNYNEQKGNAFAYCTQIVKNAFHYYNKRWVKKYDDYETAYEHLGNLGI